MWCVWCGAGGGCGWVILGRTRSGADQARNSTPPMIGLVEVGRWAVGVHTVTAGAAGRAAVAGGVERTERHRVRFGRLGGRGTRRGVLGRRTEIFLKLHVTHECSLGECSVQRDYSHACHGGRDVNHACPHPWCRMPFFPPSVRHFWSPLRGEGSRKRPPGCRPRFSGHVTRICTGLPD